ncbi:MAG: hypothetical protein GEU71_11845, partial [Actinobacteria bacterium]|nr:hypothetical protein [Actinomycetota bacterium]
TTRNGGIPASECSAQVSSRHATPSDRHPTTTADTQPKVSVKRGQGHFAGTAQVFDGERDALDAFTAGATSPGDVLVVRYEGPKGGTGMPDQIGVATYACTP